ncbi:hypothetical protein ABBQ38_012356 [Trebouxia sp. C0009 RCD-2024]
MSHTLCLLSELAELEHRLWATNKVVQDTRFRATCAMSGQLVAAQQRTLGTVCEGTRPVNSFLAPELHNPPYSHMYLDQQRCFTTDSKGTPPLHSTSRAKRPREPPVECNDPMRDQLCHHLTRFPCLPEDLYSNSHQPTIAAFRPEEFTSVSPQQSQWNPRRPHPTPAVLNPFPSDADGVCFAAALSACAESLKSQQQAHGVVERPFPGMHTLDLAFPLAQPALLEAGQQLLECPREFQAALTRCPLSQAEIRHAVIAADGFTYDALSIVQWRQQHPAFMSMISPLTGLPVLDRRLADNLSLQSLLQATAAQRLRPL